ncbi:uncharacterized protein EI97DRAFT_433923 [Westerdykella ornata]|uniref:Uncharacterized protein n=1 Tax=Westerdykella ornata TaxID=318751 RepID=A0A6A6JHV3_WESOR|nr:uncharacterized protein EI97DRAFT_433923 [Westerdykella ornata]KAF2275992.1 hypothetical protein EI97DRAFT_433923 [Westerdykella ornata]
MLPSAAELVAGYLRTNGYNETLEKFIDEAGLEKGSGSSNVISVEDLLREKQAFDLSLKFEKLGTHATQATWRKPAPSVPTVLGAVPTKANIISAFMLNLKLPGSSTPRKCIAATTADRRLNLIDPLAPMYPLIRSYVHFIDSPLLDLVAINQRFLLAGTMSGKVILYDTAADEVASERKDHTKYVVKLAAWKMPDCILVASAGWDAKVNIYRLQLDAHDNLRLGEPLITSTLPTIPETIIFIERAGSSSPVLLVTRRDSTCLFYYDVPISNSSANEMTLLGRQNLVPHSNAWIVFSPSDVQISPADPSIAAIATSSTPHMKLLVVRLLVPPNQQAGTGMMAVENDAGPPPTQAAQARAELRLQDREEAAILVSINTMAPQTAYSTPKLAWRPDGSGIYVTADDGVSRFRGKHW